LTTTGGRGTKREWAPGKWRLRVYVGRSEDGNPLQLSRNVKGNAGEADAALRKFMAEIEKGRTKRENPTVEPAREAWMANRRNPPEQIGHVAHPLDVGHMGDSLPRPEMLYPDLQVLPQRAPVMPGTVA